MVQRKPRWDTHWDFDIYKPYKVLFLQSMAKKAQRPNNSGVRFWKVFLSRSSSNIWLKYIIHYWNCWSKSYSARLDQYLWYMYMSIHTVIHNAFNIFWSKPNPSPSAHKLSFKFYLTVDSDISQICIHFIQYSEF